MFFGGATQPPEQCPPSLFMSYLSCPAISIALNKVFFGESQNQTHIFLVISTQAGVKQHGGLGKLQVEERMEWVETWRAGKEKANGDRIALRI